jgi:hypothetical protein
MSCLQCTISHSWFMSHAVCATHMRPWSKLCRLCSFLVQWQATLGRLDGVGMGTIPVGIEARQALAADLERCEKHLKDGTWTNKLNLKRALDEKVLFCSDVSHGVPKHHALLSFVRIKTCSARAPSASLHHSLHTYMLPPWSVISEGAATPNVFLPMLA